MYKKHPNTLVSNEIMQNAQSIQDIRDYISYDVIDTFVYYDIVQRYVYNNVLVNLGFSRLVVSGTSARIKVFYTANFVGTKDQDFRMIVPIHRLYSPIKYLGTELFGYSLDILQKKGVSVLEVTHLRSNDSIVFYRKMIELYGGYISSVDISLIGDLTMQLVSKKIL